MGPIQVDDRSEIAFFDVETTVPKRKGERFAILEFGSILVCPRKLEELRSFSTLVRPADLSIISSLSVRCNGITRDAVVSAPSFSDIADTIYNILHGRIWAGHNILRFDCARIREAFADIGRPAPEPIGTIDSLTLLTRKFGKRAGDMKMATLATYFGLGKQTHRSLDDVRMNLEVLKYCATVLFLESNLIGLLPEKAVFPGTSTRRGKTPKASPKEADFSAGLSSANKLAEEFHPIISLLSHRSEQPGPFDMNVIRNAVTVDALQSDINMEEEFVPHSQNMWHPLIAASEGCSGHAGYLEPNEISVSEIKATFVPFYHGSQRIKLFYANAPLQLYCYRLKVRFGIKGKFVDHAGRPRLNFVVDVCPSLCRVLETCENVAKKLLFDSDSLSDWNPVMIKKEGFVDYPTARIHIPSESNGDISQYATEMYQRDFSGTPQKMVFSRVDVADLEPLLNSGAFLDVFFTLQPYDYQQTAGIRLVAKKLLFHT